MEGGTSYHDEKVVSIDIRLTGWVVIIILGLLATAALLTYMASDWDRAQAGPLAAPQASTSGMRHFYLSPGHHWGSDSTTVCTQGFHMASFWEIADPTNLKYDPFLGITQPDSGQGPPAGSIGWVRTGYINSNTATAGQANCDSWTNDSGAGTVARLPYDWTAGWEDMGVWELYTYDCNIGQHVWCIED